MKIWLVLLALAVVSPSAQTWFDNEGPDELRAGAVAAFSNLSQAERSKLTLGDPVRLGALTEDGRTEPTSTETWIAPVLLEEEPVGGMEAYLGQDDPSVEVMSDPVLGGTLQSLTPDQRLYRDLELDAFFVLSDDKFRAGSASAQEYLAGEIPASQFSQLRAGLVKDGVTIAPVTGTETDSSTSPVILTLIILTLGLVVTLIVTWLRASSDTHDSETDERRHARRVRFYRGGEHVDVSD